MQPIKVGTFEAKTRLSELLEQVRRGRSYLITNRGRPVAELRPPSRSERRPRFGCDKDRVVIGADFDEPLADFQDYEA